MDHHTLLHLAGILVLGILAQWISWRIRLPSILLLLVAGLVAGPFTGTLKPDELFGKLLLPLVSLAVGVILYEGGLGLKLRDLRSIGTEFARLATIGVAISWIIGTLAAKYILNLPLSVAALLGAILVVTGPTVIGPILRHLRLRGKVASLLKWEGMMIDPLGATMAVLVFTIVRAAAIEEGFGDAVLSSVLTLIMGIGMGCLAAGVLIVALVRYWVPDSLHNPVSLMLMFIALTTSNMIQEESGLLAVTVMGIVMANQKWVSIGHVVEFKETLTLLLISCLFIVLSARLPIENLQKLDWHSFAFVAVMILITRPLSVLVSTRGSSLSWAERIFLCCMAPRGIVAAAISSVFALQLVGLGYPPAVEIVPVTFLMVFITVLLYGVAAAPLARKLGLVETNPQGILFVGAEPWVQDIAKFLQEAGCAVFLVDTSRENIRRARMSGLSALYGSALAEQVSEEIDFSGLGRMLAMTSNHEVNSLSCLRFIEDFGREQVYQLAFPPEKEGRHEAVSHEHRGRILFGQQITFELLHEMMHANGKVKRTKLTKEFGYDKFKLEHGETVLPLFLVRPDGKIHVYTTEGLIDPKPGDTIISIVWGN